MKTIEVSEELYEQITFLKQALPDKEGNPIENEAQVLELIVWSFMWFIEEQAHSNNVEEWDLESECCGSWKCSS